MRPPRAWTSSLPTVQERWARHLLVAPPPAEQQATCDSCVMCSRGEPDRPEQGLVWFDDLTKCCTYLPSVWNFLAGGVLADASPQGADGRRSVRARMAAGGAVTPLGLGRSPRYTMLYLAGRDGFGRTQSMRCPHHLDEGRRSDSERGHRGA